MTSNFKHTLFGLLACIAFITVPSAYASADDWQLVLEKPEDTVWQGQPADFIVLALNPPADEMELSIADNSDFIVSQRPPVRLQRNEAPAIGYPIRLTPLKAGELTLPVFSLGEQQTDASESITVTMPAMTDEMRIHVSHNTDSIYLGQTIDVEFEWITAIQPNALKAVNILLPEFENAAIRPVEPWNAFTSRDGNAIGLPIGNRRVIARWHGMPDNQYRIHFHYKIQPLEAGTFELQPGVLMASVDQRIWKHGSQQFRGSRFPAHFDNNFFEAERVVKDEPPVRLMTRSKPLRFTVKDLPAGAPEHFTGMVGRPDIKFTAEPETVRQGEPMQLRFDVVHPHSEISQLPDLQKERAFIHSFDIPGSASPAVYEDDVRVVRQSLFPKLAETSEIPPVVISYFDPDTGHYRDYVTETIPLTVIPVERFNISSSELSADVTLSNPVKADKDGIWEHNWTRQLMDNRRQQSALKPWILFALLVCPPAMVLFGLSPALRKRWVIYRNSSAIAQLRSELAKTNDSLAPLGTYFHRRIRLLPSKLNEQTLTARLAALGVDQALIEETIQCLSREQQLYAKPSSSNNVDRSSHRKALIDLVLRLDKALPARGVLS
ncbi:hypothetical protein GZ77_25495 [Endozoicomonas montiporae]|uniref:Protein BatD n=2 Tax=Endozoicomonas montiporae TaxID=1027273 RepID=A0A081MZ34_9GAMM|nr:BatD family protein [Endozoicomonas montiporae]AMO54930.1 hypothetical protein EZMO1_0693 [Endozoicomonas montiporae CL-33]KEQ11457.1 hypothetical protein GZ77_25495 [Endozoicomonas montiporae]